MWVDPIWRLSIAVLLLTVAAGSVCGYTFTTMDHPLAAPGQTFAQGISGGTVVGFYGDGTNAPHAFTYGSGTYTSLDAPLATKGTFAWGTWANSVVGSYMDDAGTHGFIESGGVFTTIDHPGAQGTVLTGMYGDTVVGTYGPYGFTETGGVFTTLDYPIAEPHQTLAMGIFGNTVVGYVNVDLGAVRLYDGTKLVSSYTLAFSETDGVYTPIGDPVGSVGSTAAYGISGDGIVGTYADAVGAHGFVYVGGQFTTIDHPSAVPGYTYVYGISDGVFVGTYVGEGGGYHGFTAAVPEPGGAVLPAGAGFVAFWKVRRRR